MGVVFVLGVVVSRVGREGRTLVVSLPVVVLVVPPVLCLVRCLPVWVIVLLRCPPACSPTW